MSDFINLWRVRAAFADGLFNGAGGVLVITPVNRLFATGFRSSAGMLLITEKSTAFITDFRYFEAACAKISDAETILLERGQKYSDIINGILDRDGVSSLAYEDRGLTVAEKNALEKAIRAEFLPMGRAMEFLRAQKNEYELSRMQKAQDITDVAFTGVLPRIRAGMSEKQVEAELIYCLYKAGAEQLSFDPIVVSGPNSALPHGRAGDRLIEPGDFLTMDFGAVYDGYCADMTRTVGVGRVSDEQREIYGIVLEAQLLGLASARAGLVWSDVDKTVRDFITEKGFGQYFGHGLGHSLGIEVHENVDYSENEPGKTGENCVVSVEPGIYLPGKFGVRIEDCIVLKENGNINMANSPKELIEL